MNTGLVLVGFAAVLEGMRPGTLSQGLAALQRDPTLLRQLADTLEAKPSPAASAPAASPDAPSAAPSEDATGPF